MGSELRSLLAALACCSCALAWAQVDKFQKAIPAAEVKAVDHARSLRLRGRNADAADELRGVVSRQPDYFNARYELGLALSEEPDTFRQSIPVLKTAADLKRAHPEVTDAHVFNTLGWAYVMANKPKDAEAALKEAESNIDQLDTEARKRLYNNLGFLYMREGRLADSEKYLKLAADKYGSAQAKTNLRALELVKKQETAAKK